MVASVSSPAAAYRKLTPMHRGLGAMTQLWLGSDHLLHLQSTGYSESYRRFYLRDIQCLVMVHTARRTYLAAALAVLLLGIVIILVTADAGPVGYAVMAGVFLPFFLWNHLLGAGCRVVVVTAVQQENVTALSRLPKTRRILAELKPRIEAAQADLPAAPAGHAPVDPAPTAPDSLPPPLPPS